MYLKFLFYSLMIGDLVPELYEYYPDQAMELHVSASNPPSVRFTPEGNRRIFL